ERAPYDGEIASVDHELGRLLAALRQRTANLAVIVTSDHGESLGEHGETTHGLFLSDATVRIPLLMTAPALPSGARVAAPVSLVDVMPTILELVGADPVPGLDGRSLLALARGADGDGSRALYLETELPRYTFGWSASHALVHWPFKLVLASAPELYDL